MNDWKNTYFVLDAFIKANDKVKIDKRITVIPEEFRGEFYRLFNLTRHTFVKERCPVIFNQAVELSAHYTHELSRFCELMGITEVKLPSSLDWLLKEPAAGLSRPLFEQLFRLIKGDIAIDEFQPAGQDTIAAFSKPLLKMGYEKWVILSLSNMLSPLKALALPWEELETKCPELQPDEKRGFREYSVPFPQKIERLQLGHEGHAPSFIIADIIIQSELLDCFVSFGADLTDASWSAKNFTLNREAIALRQLGNELWPHPEWPDLVIYIDEKVQNIGLITDFSRFLRPEIIIECMDSPAWHQEGRLEIAKRNYDFFNPRLGSFIICKEEPPEGVELELVNSDTDMVHRLEPGICEPDQDSQIETAQSTLAGPQRNIMVIPNVGFDNSRLEPVINVLRKHLCV